MSKLKSILSFKKDEINSIELKKVNGGKANTQSERIDNVCTGSWEPGVTENDCGFKLDGVFNPYPKGDVDVYCD
ncbi:MAG: hypothetical protein ACOVMH_08570 [Flavobacterium sp.]